MSFDYFRALSFLLSALKRHFLSISLFTLTFPNHISLNAIIGFERLESSKSELIIITQREREGEREKTEQEKKYWWTKKLELFRLLAGLFIIVGGLLGWLIA